MPIWSMTCCQLWLEPSFFRPATSCSLILMMRLAMPECVLCCTYHIARSSGVFRMVVAILAPFIDSTLLASSASLHTTVNPPTRSPRPMFLASRSMSPLAKPWYAMSKNTSRFRFLWEIMEGRKERRKERVKRDN
uniref:Uncharacterized protein n=1 Tax=Myripristis murdjan TaxID=586833 RepID=A0A667YSE9_9TELE